MRRDLNGSPVAVSRKLSINGKQRSSFDNIPCAVPTELFQSAEEQSTLAKNLDKQVESFVDSLGAIASEPVWNNLIRKISRAISKWVPKALPISEELGGMITTNGEVSADVETHIPGMGELDLYAQHCLKDLLTALARYQCTTRRAAGSEETESKDAATGANVVVCGA